MESKPEIRVEDFIYSIVYKPVAYGFIYLSIKKAEGK
jgi:hypothetical protein